MKLTTFETQFNKRFFVNVMMRISFTFFIAAITGMFISSGCNMINPVEKTPTYIHIDSFQFIGGPGLGTWSQHITNVRVNFDNQTVGIFDLPANIPVLADKRGVLSLTPGVAYDGLVDVQVSYPFFKTDTFTIDPQPGKTINLVPKARYYDSTVFNMSVVDFEGRDNPFVVISGPETYGLDSSTEVFEGRFCGRMSLSSKQEMEIVLQRTFGSTPQGFVELNYKSTVPFAIGLEANNGEVTEYFVGIKPQNRWTKIYIALADFIFKYPLKTYRLIIKAMSETDAGGYVSIDNVKILQGK